MSRHRKRRGASTRPHARNTHQAHGDTVSRALTSPDELADRTTSVYQFDAAELLRKAREDKGLSVDDLSRTTKISRTMLSALESFDVSHLPSGIYTRGFVKAYAREVGLDPEEMAQLYLGDIEHARPSKTETVPVGVAAPVAHSAMMRLDDDIDTILASPQARRVGWLVTACCAIGLIVYVWSFGRERPSDTVPATQSVAPVDAAPAAAANPHQPDAVRAGSDALTGPLHIELRPSGLCWVLVTADGEQVLAKLLRDGDQQTFTANEELRLRVGDPGAFTYSINGRNGRPLGRAGEPIDVRITRDNFRDFIES